MARFPKREADIAALTKRVITGLTSYAEDFPSPPAPPPQLEEALAAYDAAKDAAIAADGAAIAATSEKDERLETLTDLLKADLRYAEVTTRDAPEMLSHLGWGPRRDGSPLDTPGQARSLDVSSEGPGWVVLDWKAPTEGGAVTAYRIRRSRADVEQWQDVGMSVDTSALVSGQERGVQLVFRVIAVNKAGEGMPSNIVTAVL
jgi:hypothetical protein